MQNYKPGSVFAEANAYHLSTLPTLYSF